MARHIYIAGPIGKGPVVWLNVLAAINAADEVRNLGAMPYVPHLSAFWHAVHPREYEDWMSQDFEWIRRCDGLLRIGGESPGADREVAFAKSINRPVFNGVRHLASWLRGEPSSDEPYLEPTSISAHGVEK